MEHDQLDSVIQDLQALDATEDGREALTSVMMKWCDG